MRYKLKELIEAPFIPLEPYCKRKHRCWMKSEPGSPVIMTPPESVDDIPTEDPQLKANLDSKSSRNKRFKEICQYVAAWEWHENPDLDSDAIRGKYIIRQAAKVLGRKVPGLRKFKDWTRLYRPYPCPTNKSLSIVVNELLQIWFPDKFKEILSKKYNHHQDRTITGHISRLKGP